MGVKVGILICWDNNLIENPRVNALLGADIILAPIKQVELIRVAPMA